MIQYFTVIVIFLNVLIGDGARRQRITPPIIKALGDPPIHEPGWKCVTNMRAVRSWKQLRGPGYREGGLPKTQIQCSWIIEAPLQYRVMVSFRDLHMPPPTGVGDQKNCRSPFIDIIDIAAEKSQGRFCGNNPPGDYVSKGTVLRIDYQGAKFRSKYRGFLITYKITTEMPGFRAPKKVNSPSDSAPGKINFNEFKSTKQRTISTSSNNQPSRRRPPSGPKSLVYASDIRTAPATITTTMYHEGWAGGRLARIPQGERNIGNGAKFRAKTTTKPVPNGQKVIAINQKRPSNSKKQNPNGHSGGKVKVSQPPDSGWVDPGLKSQQAESPPRFFGENLQYTNDDSRKSGMMKELLPRSNGNAEAQKGDLSTIHLIIIIVGIIVCILLVAGMFLVKHFIFDKKRKQNEKRKTEAKNETSGSTHSVGHVLPLPGLTRDGSLRSTRSQVTFHEDPRLSRHPSLVSFDRMTSQRNGSMSRHQSLVAKHEAIYRNHHAMIKQARNNPNQQQQRDKSRQRRINVIYSKRPLPPIPKPTEKHPDMDEDYCSGSDEDPDVAPMKRELSEWEIEEEKRNKTKFRDKYM